MSAAVPSGREPADGPATDRTVTAATGRPAAADAGTLSRLVLPSGLTVLVRESRSAPVVAITLLARAGSADEPPERNGVTALLGRVLLKGTTTRSALDVARAAEDAGGGLDSAADQEYAELRAWGLARRWRSLLALVHDVVTAPRLAEEEIERERRVLLAQIRGLEDQPAQIANRVLARALFGPRGYGLAPSGDLTTVGRIARDDLASRFRAGFSADRLIIGISGAVSAAEVLAEVAERFGGLAAGAPPEAPPPAPERPVRLREQEVTPTQQAHLLFGFHAPPVGHADHVALKVMNGVLGGGMSSRLFRTLRDAEGLAYSVGSVYPTRRAGGRLVVHIGTAPQNLPAAESGIRREIERLASEPVPEDELERTKTYLVGSFLLDRRTNGRQSFSVAFYETMGVGADYVTRYPGLLHAVDAPDVLRVARRHLVEPAVVAVGPAA